MESDDTSGSGGAEVGFAVLGGLAFTGSGVWWAEGKKLVWGRSKSDAGVLENHGVDRCAQGWAFDVVFEFVSRSRRGSQICISRFEFGLVVT